MNSGIYCIENLVNGKCILVNLQIWKREKTTLVDWKQYFKLRLQRAFDKYNKDSLDFCSRIL
jgi:hypothetical protein